MKKYTPYTPYRDNNLIINSIKRGVLIINIALNTPLSTPLLRPIISI